MTEPRHDIGIDIGGTSVRVALFDARRALVSSETHATPRRADDIAPLLGASIDRLLGGSDATSRSGLDLVGVGIPGRVDPDAGVVRDAVNLGMDGAVLRLGPVLAERLGRVVHVENDVNAATLGAFHDDVVLGRTLAYLSVGTGIAAGLLVDGELMRGRCGLAGEIGHLPLDRSGPLCTCGQTGCLEALASGSAIARRWPVADGSPSTALAAAALDGDPRAATIWSDVVDGLAWAVQVLVLTIDADAVVVGGGVSEAGSVLLDGIVERLEPLGRAVPFFEAAGVAGRVRLLAGDALIGCLGALLAAERARPVR